MPDRRHGTFFIDRVTLSRHGADMTEQGLAAVFLAQRPMLVRLIAARLGNRDEAEEVVQELWLKLARLATGPIADPVAYLFRMAANLATDRRVAATRRTVRDDAWRALQPGDDDPPDDERRLQARDELRRVAATLDAMPERMRRAVLMFRVEGQSQQAIAVALGISVSGVEKLLQRAYRTLLESRSEDLARPHRLAGEGHERDE